MKALLVAICVWLSGPGQVELPTEDELPNWPERQLQFQKVDKPLVLGENEPQAVRRKARYAASVSFSEIHLSIRDKAKEAPDVWLLQAPSAEELSQEQRDFLRTADVVRVTRLGRTSPAEPVFSIRLYAISEADARAMVRAALECFDAPRREEFERKRQAVLSHVYQLEKARQELQEFLREHPDPAAELEEIKRTVWYKQADEAREDIRELEKAMRAVDVDIAGITAKTEAIHKHMREPTSPGVREALRRLLIEQDVEMAGAVARKDALEAHVRRARAYLAALEVTEEHRRLVWRVRQHELSIARALEELDSPRERLRPIEPDGPVRIQAIKYPDGLAE